MPASYADDYDIAQFVAAIQRSAANYQWSAVYMTALAAMPLGVVLILPSGGWDALNSIYSGKLDWVFAVGIGIGCGAVAYLFASQYTRPRIEMTRQFVLNNMVACGMVESALAEDAYDRMPDLGAYYTKYGIHRLWRWQRAKTQRGKLLQLISSYSLCMGDEFKSPAWPGWNRSLMTIVYAPIILMLIWGLVFRLYNPRHAITFRDDPVSQWITDNPWAWHLLIVAVLCAICFVVWDMCVDSAAVRLALADALERQPAHVEAPAPQSDDPAFSIADPDNPAAQTGGGWD